jgi:hypothetical protein
MGQNFAQLVVASVDGFAAGGRIDGLGVLVNLDGLELRPIGGCQRPPEPGHFA